MRRMFESCRPFAAPFAVSAAPAPVRAPAFSGAAFSGALALLSVAAFCIASPLSAQTVTQAAAQAAKSHPQPGKAQPAKAQLVKEGENVGFRVRSQPLAITPISLDVGKFAFTAPGSAAGRAESGHAPVMERGFTFTPSRSAKGGVSVGMTTRTAMPPAGNAASNPAAADSSPASSNYNFDLSVGYRGFAVSGGASHVDTGIGGRNRETVDVGIGYGARNWRAGLQASSERESVNLMPRAGGDSQRYTVEARGALDLSPKISVGGTLRYRPATQNPTLLDQLRDDRAVIVGGAVVF